jgi:phage shock protein A
MSAAVAMERGITVEDRIAGLESDMRYVRSDIAEMKGDIKSLRTELQSFKTDVAKEFGNVRTKPRRPLRKARPVTPTNATGVADYVEVTTTHIAALQVQRDTITVRVAQLNASVALVRTTGGGWTRDQLDRPVLP